MVYCPSLHSLWLNTCTLPPPHSGHNWGVKGTFYIKSVLWTVQPPISIHSNSISSNKCKEIKIWRKKNSITQNCDQKSIFFINCRICGMPDAVAAVWTYLKFRFGVLAAMWTKPKMFFYVCTQPNLYKLFSSGIHWPNFITVFFFYETKKSFIFFLKMPQFGPIVLYTTVLSIARIFRNL